MMTPDYARLSSSEYNVTKPLIDIAWPNNNKKTMATQDHCRYRLCRTTINREWYYKTVVDTECVGLPSTDSGNTRPL